MKAILFCRVSTDRQEVEEQRNDLIKYAMEDGYSRENLIVVEGVGASAIKLNELYNEKIEEIFHLIESDSNIKAVYVWDVDRLGRNELILMKVKYFLLEHNVNLIVKTLNLRMLNEDGNEEQAFAYAFSILGLTAKIEMDIKKRRFARTNSKKKREGLFTGGQHKFGYTADKQGNYIIHEENSKHVQDMFRMYMNGQSLASIFKHFSLLGVFKNMERKPNQSSKVRKILSDTDYLGQGNKPRIIDDETFGKVQEILKERREANYHPTSKDYLCKSILYDMRYNTKFTASIGITSYVSVQKGERYALNMNAMDCLVWWVAKQWLIHVIDGENESRAEKAQRTIDENIIKAESIKGLIKEEEKRAERALDIYIAYPTRMPKDKLDATIKETDRAIAKHKKALSELEEENMRLTNLINTTVEDDKYFMYSSSELDMLPQSEQYLIVQKTVSKIEVSKHGNDYHLIFRSQAGDKMELDYSIWHNTKVRFFMEGKDVTDLIENMSIARRYKRKSY